MANRYAEKLQKDRDHEDIAYNDVPTVQTDIFGRKLAAVKCGTTSEKTQYMIYPCTVPAYIINMLNIFLCKKKKVSSQNREDSHNIGIYPKN